jgi:hypothetical protein
VKALIIRVTRNPFSKIRRKLVRLLSRVGIAHKVLAFNDHFGLDQRTKQTVFPEPPWRYQYFFPARQEIVCYRIQPGLYLDIFWKILPIGKEPALSIFLHEQELLRFDCFGGGKGHYHLLFCDSGFSYRHRLSGETVSAQIDAIFLNLNDYLSLHIHHHTNPKLRDFSINTERLNMVCAQARLQMHDYVNEVPQLEDLRV